MAVVALGSAVSSGSASAADDVTGDITANCTFGGADGSTLYMTTNHSIMRIRTSTKGLGF